MAVHLAATGGSPRNALPASVRTLEPRGEVVRVALRVAGQDLLADLTAHAVAELGLAGTSAVRHAFCTVTLERPDQP